MARARLERAWEFELGKPESADDTGRRVVDEYREDLRRLAGKQEGGWV